MPGYWLRCWAPKQFKSHHEGTKDTKKHEEGQVKSRRVAGDSDGQMDLNAPNFHTVPPIFFVFLRDLCVFVMRIECE